jgi:hypothetical protein
MNTDDGLQPGTEAWAAALSGVSDHGFSGHGREVPELTLGDYVQETANSISAADVIVGFQQTGGENFLCADLEQGRATWVNTSHPERSTSFVPPNGLEGYVERAIRDRSDESPRAIRDDLGFFPDVVSPEVQDVEPSPAGALDLGPSVPAGTEVADERAVGILDLGPSVPAGTEVADERAVGILDLGPSVPTMTTATASMTETVSNPKVGQELHSETVGSPDPLEIDEPADVAAPDPSDIEQDGELEPGGKA